MQNESILKINDAGEVDVLVDLLNIEQMLHAYLQLIGSAVNR